MVPRRDDGTPGDANSAPVGLRRDGCRIDGSPARRSGGRAIRGGRVPDRPPMATPTRHSTSPPAVGDGSTATAVGAGETAPPRPRSPWGGEPGGPREARGETDPPLPVAGRPAPGAQAGRGWRGNRAARVPPGTPSPAAGAAVPPTTAGRRPRLRHRTRAGSGRPASRSMRRTPGTPEEGGARSPASSGREAPSAIVLPERTAPPGAGTRTGPTHGGGGGNRGGGAAPTRPSRPRRRPGGPGPNRAACPR
jgi:hypothetical protein